MAMVIEAIALASCLLRVNRAGFAMSARSLLFLNNRHLPNEIAPERDSEAILVRAVGLDPHDVAIEGF